MLKLWKILESVRSSSGSGHNIPQLVNEEKETSSILSSVEGQFEFFFFKPFDNSNKVSPCQDQSPITWCYYMSER